MKVLGIDQSYTSAGYCIIDENEEVLEFGTIKTTQEDGDIFTRARIITNSLKKIADDNAVDFVGLEGLAFGGFGNATRDLAGLLFTIINGLSVDNPNIKYALYTPLSIKKYATGSGKSKKQQMMDALPENTRKLFTNKGFKKTSGLTDITDAYWIARYTLKNNDI